MNGKKVDRRDFLKIGAAAAAAAAIDPLGAAAVSTPAKRPNIIFVFSDEHRWCSLPFTQMPEVTAPNMERMAREGMQGISKSPRRSFNSARGSSFFLANSLNTLLSPSRHLACEDR